MKKIKNLAIRLAILAIPAIGLAQTAAPGTSVDAPDVGSYQTELDVTTLWTKIGIWLNWIVALVGIVSVVMLLYGAVMYMTAGQNEEHLAKAKNSVVYGIVGAVVAVLAFSIFKFASSLVGADTSNVTGHGI